LTYTKAAMDNQHFIPSFFYFELSGMMSFLAYITGFFMNFELLPIFTDYAN
jgi:hypothetical protein